MPAGELHMWTVYKDPADYPGKYVARRFAVVGDKVCGTNDFIVDDSIDVIRNVLARGGLVPIERSPEDDPCIVETWT